MLVRTASVLALGMWTTSAHAQAEVGGSTTEPAPSEATSSAESGSEIPGESEADAPEVNRGFRNGFSLSAGQEFGTSAAGADISGQLYGLDWRIGSHVTDAVSVHLHSHLSLGTASVGGSSGLTGNLAAAVVGEYEFPMRVFAGGGGGYGVLNNPSGPLAELRAGWYPFEHKTGTARRLNVALDARWYFVDDAGTGVTVTHIALSLGYDRF